MDFISVNFYLLEEGEGEGLNRVQRWEKIPYSWVIPQKPAVARADTVRTMGQEPERGLPRSGRSLSTDTSLADS